ncbi:hypothetical protein [Dyadobacter bucti]|uniref:hypothetical protein n=1 Tax=Dyadobacter bucti TaxID=2572203 RepID=UPI003F71B00C
MSEQQINRIKELVLAVQSGKLDYDKALGALIIKYSSEVQRDQIVRLAAGFRFEQNQTNSLIELYSYQSDENTIFFLDKLDFESRVDRSNFDETIVVIGRDAHSGLIWDGATESTIQNGTISESNFYFKNILSYFRILDFLKSLDSSDDQPFHFIDHYNEVSRQLILTSSKKEGKLIIPFKNFIPKYPEDQSLQLIADRFINSFALENKHLPKFIKAYLFESIPKIDKDNRMQFLINNLSDILNASSQNFEIYLSDLSLENLRKEYLSTRDKAFQQYRDILGKVTTQIIGFPVALSATAFATYKAIDGQNYFTTVLVLFLILTAFLLFSFFNIFVLKIHRHDIDDLSSSFQIEYSELISSNFFVKFPAETSKFETIRVQIDRKLRMMREVVIVYFWSTLFVNMLFCLFIFGQMILGFKIAYSFLLLIVLISLAYHFWRS